MLEKIKRNLQIVELRKKGKSYNTIAKYYNLTPQRIYAISKKYGVGDNCQRANVSVEINTIDNIKDDLL